MKKISKEYVITRERFHLEYIAGEYSLVEFGLNCDPLKLTISQEYTEKKIEISESEFDKIYDEVFQTTNPESLYRKDLKQKLFGKTE